MSYVDLQSFLRDLESTGDLKRVAAEVDPELEVTEIATRLVRDEGPAVLFENVKGSSYPLAINILASGRRIERALGVPPGELGEELARFVERVNPPTLGTLWAERSTAWKLLKTRPLNVRRAPVQEVVPERPDLGELPILKCWPEDGGKFITFPLVMTRDPETGAGNLGIYRMHVYDGRTTGMHMQAAKGGGFHYYKAEKRGEPLEVAVALGGDPALLLASVLPLPEGLDEIAFSGLMRNRRTPLKAARTVHMRVPANAEFILEGLLLPEERQMEGPFGDHFGHYSEAHEFPVFHIRAITHRRSPIYPATVVGKPPQEDRYLGDAGQELLNPLIRLVHPEIRDMWAYYESGFHHLLVVAVEPRFTREHLKTAMGLFGQGQLALTKALVLVNPGVNVRDFSAVLKAIRHNFEAPEDFLLIARAPGDTLDFTTPQWHHGSKIVIDATGEARPAAAVPMPANLRAIAPDIVKTRLVGRTLLAVQAERNARGTLETLVHSPYLSSVKIVAVVSEDIDIQDDVQLIWGIFTRFDPARDIVFSEMRMEGAVPAYRGIMGIDASFKQGYPAPLTMRSDIVEKVDRRWDEYWR